MAALIAGMLWGALALTGAAIAADAPAANTSTQPAGAAQEEEMADSMKMPEMPKGSGENNIGWMELTTKDAAGFQKFYGELFGWSFQPFQDDYFMYQTPKGVMGGVRINPPEGSPNCTYFIGVKDLDATMASIEAAGGKIVVPKEKVGEWGYIAFFKDRNDVIVGLSDMVMPIDYHPDPMVSQSGLVPGSYVAVEVYGGDLASTKEFYGGLFGWSMLETMPQYMMFNTGMGLGGVFQGHTPQAHVMPYVWVEDVSATLDKIVAAGGQKLGEPMAMPGTPVFGYFLDPYGNGMGLMGPK
jgi:predicted enzyme related to lactoylglutathione lyase